MALDNSQSRWDGWTVLVGSASMVPNFTETGFAVARAPDWVTTLSSDRKLPVLLFLLFKNHIIKFLKKQNTHTHTHIPTR
jgi:hypothetical protein